MEELTKILYYNIGVSILYAILPIVLIVTSISVITLLIQIKYEIKNNKEYLKVILTQLKQQQIELNDISIQIKKANNK